MSIRRYQAEILLLMAALSWGLTFALVQDAVRDVPVYTFLFLRFGLAFVLMSMISFGRWSHLDRSTIFAAVVLGVLNLGAYAFQTYGLTMILSSTAAFITGLFVVLVPLMAFLFFRQSVGRSVWAGSILALIGLWMLTAQSKLSIGLGEIYTLVCAVLFALHVLFTDRFSRTFDVYMLLTLQLGTISAGSAVMGMWYDGTIWPREMSYSLGIALVITVVFATIFAFGVQTSMQRYSTPGRVALIFTMEPLSAAVFGHYYLGEILGVSQMFGGMLIIAGVLVSELKKS